MAIQDDDNASGTTAASKPQAANPTPNFNRGNAGAGFGGNGQQGTGLISSWGAQVMSARMGSEGVAAMAKKMQAEYDAQPVKGFKFRVDVLDKNSHPDLYYATIMVTCALANSTNGIVAQYGLIMASTNNQPQDDVRKLGSGREAVVKVTPDQAWDGALRNILSQAAQGLYPTYSVVSADAMVIGADTPLEDPNLIRRLAATAADALATELQRHMKIGGPLNLASAQNDNSLVVSVDFNRTPTMDVLGDPVRSDWKIQLVSRQPTNNQNGQPRNSLNSSGQEQALSAVSGFVDLIYAPENQQNGVFDSNQNKKTAIYAANLVVTQIHSHRVATTSAQLLGMILALASTTRDLWVNALRTPPLPGTARHHHDIGAVNIEANFENNPNGYGNVVDTRSDSFTDQDFGDLIRATIRKQVVMSLDIPDCGQQTSALSIFAAAAAGDQNAAKAILVAANELTDGNFSQIFNSVDSLFAGTPSRIFNGKYHDRATNTWADIRNIDTLMVGNVLGVNSPEVMAKWSDTFSAFSVPPEIRLEERLKIMQAVVGNGSEIILTGMSTRLTFNSLFLMAVIQGGSKAGFNPRFQTNQYGGLAETQRATASLGNAFMDATGLTTYNYNGPTSNYGSGSFGGTGRSW